MVAAADTNPKPPDHPRDHSPAMMMASYAEKVERFHQTILPAQSVLIVTHDYPDPDCLASAYAFSSLLAHWGMKTAVITFGGFVGRAENRAMIRFLNISTVPYVLIELHDFERIILVDCFPGKGNVSLPPHARIDAIFDHHLDKPPIDAPYFHDVRNDLGATATIATNYLLAADCPITPKLATALFYGIKSDTNGGHRETSNEDLACYKMLFEIMDHRLLSRIEHPDRDPEFFRTLHNAAESMLTFGPVGYSHVGTVSTPDYVAEMADFFYSLEKIDWMICSGTFKKNIFFSLRSKKMEEAGKKAETIARALGGSGGGHGMMGAGKIPFEAHKDKEMLEQFFTIVKTTFAIGSESGKRII